MIIEVTDKHISHGLKQSCSSCPIALAIREKLPQGYVARVYYNHAYVYKGDSEEPVSWDPIVHTSRQWIGLFDRGLPVEPFKFELKLEPVLEKINESIYL